MILFHYLTLTHELRLYFLGNLELCLILFLKAVCYSHNVICCFEVLQTMDENMNAEEVKICSVNVNDS